MKMKKVSIAICDDVMKEAQSLEQMLKKLYPGTETLLFSDGDSLLDALDEKRDHFSVVFLDIHMPGMNGIQIAKEIRDRDMTVPIVIFSKDDSYYREAFDVHAFQYLLKPFTEESLVKALGPLTRQWGEGEEKVVHFRYRSQLYTIKLSKISYISSSLHTVNFHLVSGENAHCRGKLNDFDDQLEDSSFIRCHQSFYVNMEKVVGMKTDSFIMKDGIIPISRSYAKEVQKKYTTYLETRGK